MGYIVYKHTAPNGKCYIGVTKNSMEHRAQGGRGYVGNHAFYNAIQKYGWENFSHEILESDLTPEEASEKEKEYIKWYRSLSTENGYNIETGGLTHFRLSEETKRKLSLARKGKPMPPRGEEYRKKLSASLTGRTFSPEHCKHISEGKRGTQAGRNNPRARKVLCVETGQVFDTIKEAGIFKGGSPKNIISCCAGRLKTSGGYHWQYVSETEV